jgi:hypothetical protein
MWRTAGLHACHQRRAEFRAAAQSDRPGANRGWRMRDRFFDQSAWRRTMDGWRLAINGHTVDLVELPAGFFTPIVDWLTSMKSFAGAPSADLPAAIAYAWPLVGEALQSGPNQSTLAPKSGAAMR